MSLPLVNAIDGLCSAILSFQGLIPSSNIEELLIEDLLMNNFLTALHHRHKKLTSNQQAAPSDIERLQLAFEYICGDGATSVFIKEALNSGSELAKRYSSFLKELASRGLAL